MEREIRRSIQETRFGQMHVRVSTGKGRPLLALHMSPLSSAMWLPLMERLDRPVIAPDRLGFGFSDAPTATLSMDEYAAATLDALDAIHPRGRVDVVGEHTGSVEAVALAHRATSRVLKIALIAVPLYTDEERVERMATRGAAPVPPDEEGTQFIARWKRRLRYREPPYDYEYLHDLTVQELVSAGPHLAYRAVFSYPMAERLPTVPVPGVVFAPHDDLHAQTARARRLLPENWAYVDLEDLGLDLFHEAPDRMAALIREHLGTGDAPDPPDEED